MRRVVSIVWAAWFAVIGFEPSAFGACPMHAFATQAVAQPAGHLHGHDGGHESGHPHAPSCQCPGNCCGPTLGPALSSMSLVVATEVPSRFHVAVAYHLYYVRGDFVLPFANAPPDAWSV